MADISIAGSGKLNYTNVDNQTAADTNLFSTDLVVTLTGKSGDTSVVIKQEYNDNANTDNTRAMMTKSAYMASNIAGVNVKAGTWFSADSLLGNGTQSDGAFSADYTVEGVKVQYENKNTASGVESTGSWTVSGAVQGVSLSHEMHENADTDTKVSGSVAGVDIAYRSYDSDTATSDKESIEVNYTTNGITLTYADVDVNSTGTTTSDAFFGTQASAVGDMTGFGISTAVAGNTVALKSYKINPTNAAGAVDDEYTKVVVTRPLASGSTFEATYTDKDDKNSTADSTTLDLELSVKF
ncbi:MAG: hypothetical protein HOC17_01270 [Candidatus Ruthia sp.]|nr:hypothetical protein [Candidatus Ruthturnera sp.]